MGEIPPPLRLQRTTGRRFARNDDMDTERCSPPVAILRSPIIRMELQYVVAHHHASIAIGERANLGRKTTFLETASPLLECVAEMLPPPLTLRPTSPSLAEPTEDRQGLRGTSRGTGGSPSRMEGENYFVRMFHR